MFGFVDRHRDCIYCNTYIHKYLTSQGDLCDHVRLLDDYLTFILMPRNAVRHRSRLNKALPESRCRHALPNSSYKVRGQGYLRLLGLELLTTTKPKVSFGLLLYKETQSISMELSSLMEHLVRLNISDTCA